MFSELALGAWSGLGIGWWFFAWRLVAGNGQSRGPAETLNPEPDAGLLSIFKPLAPLGARGLSAIEAGLESFVAQLDESSELLLGVHEADRLRVAPFLDRMRASYPAAQLRAIYRTEPDEFANPKVAWQKFLAPHAQGDLWLWSDADIQIPPGFLHSIREEYARLGVAMLTCPYVVREMSSRPALFDALYVNVEFLPGVLLLRGRGPVNFGLGAAMLFRRHDFFSAVAWPELGSALADDFVLAQKLRPIRVSETTLVTVAHVSTWKEALLHYLRWSKTVWWNRPGGSAARVVVLPVLGWLAYLAFHPTQGWAWTGLIAMMQVDVLFAALLCRAVGCPWKLRDLPGTEAWSLWRIGVWIACWLPWPVVWRGRRWKGPRV